MQYRFCRRFTEAPTSRFLSLTGFTKVIYIAIFDALMEIGDFYISIDKSLQDKAMKAWEK